MLVNTNLSTSYGTYLTVPLSPRVQDIGERAMRELTLDSGEIFLPLAKNKIYALRGDVSVPIFNHPLIYADQKSNLSVFVDNRANYNAPVDRIKNPTEYNFNNLRAFLEYFWLTSNGSFVSVKDFIIDVFASWTSTSFARLWNLSVVQASQVRVVMAVYYNSFFTTMEDPEAYALKNLSILLRTPKQVISDLIDLSIANNSPLKNIVEAPIYTRDTKDGKGFSSTKMIAMYKFIGDNIISAGESFLKQQNVNILLNGLINGGFAGANNTEITAIAVEHPPAMLAIMKRCLEDGFQKKFKIGMAVDSVKRNYDITEFNKFFTYLTHALTDDEGM